MAVQNRRDDAAVEDVLRPGSVPGKRRPATDRLIAVPVALDAEPVLVQGPASPAVVAGDGVLEGLCASPRLSLVRHIRADHKAVSVRVRVVLEYTKLAPPIPVVSRDT